jgi:LPXTG-site transpeptidase (sortase) family protein
MHGRHRRSSGRGRLVLTASVLGLSLVAGGVAAAGGTPETGSLPGRSAAPWQAHWQAFSSPYVTEAALRFEAATPQPSRPTPLPGRGVPTRVVLPALGLNTLVVPVAASHGVLVPPADAQVLGWWREGAEPGAARGSALIAGHTVSAGSGAFDDLGTLDRGRLVRIRTTRGVVDYRVERVHVYRKAGLARHASRLFSQSVRGRLVLVTCDRWNGTAYLSNAVVVARPVG